MSENFTWPDERRSLFARPSKGPESPTWCSLEWLSSSKVDEAFLSTEFIRAADRVISSLATGTITRQPDGLFMPVAYLYRHALELQLKHLVRLGLAAQFLAPCLETDDALTKHNLVKLWDIVKTAIEKRWPKENRTIVNNTAALIQEFQRIDKSGQNLRYTQNRQGKSTACKYPVAIELTDLRNAFHAVHNLLSCCATEIEEVADYIAQATHDSE